MIEIKLKAVNDILIIVKYRVYYPFSVNIYDKSKIIYWNVASLSCKKNQGSFKLYYARKFNASGLKDKSGDEKNIVGGKLINMQDVAIQGDSTAEQYFIFQKNLLIYVNEENSNSYMNEKQNILPVFLLNNEANVKESVHFWLEYNNENIKLKNEEINLQLNLEYDEQRK